VLEIGTGSGYQAAILAQLASDVYTIERIEALYQRANAAFRRLDIYNVHTRFGDGARGWPECAPYDAIIITAAAESVPETLLNQLNEGGRLIMPIGLPGEQVLQLITRHGNAFRTISLERVRFVPFKEGIE
jgi:protein-L-isoaspartate(D-aspartate) O-methyltransferase